MNPEFQTELHQTLKKEMYSGITYEGLKKVKIVDACIKESMRLYTAGLVQINHKNSLFMLSFLTRSCRTVQAWTFFAFFHKNEGVPLN